MTGDRSDIDDRPLSLVQGRGEAPRQLQGREEIQLEDLVPILDVAVEHAQALGEGRLRADPGIIDQGLDRAPVQPVMGLGDKASRLSESARSVGICLTQFGLRRHSSGISWRAQDRTCQPSCMKRRRHRMTDSWLAPVR